MRAKRSLTGQAGETALKRSRLYSEELGIALSRNTEQELFKWFLASILFGARISETIARHTYQSFARYRLLDPRRILAAGWDFLVNPVLREGGYVRYDEKTAREVLDNCAMLINEYRGRLRRLHELARDSQDLEARLLNFYGIGPITVNIFLRELRPFWKKSNPEPLPLVRQLAAQRGIDLERYRRKSLTFARIEAGLIRARKTSRGGTARPRTPRG
jgi:hypothetical protein